MDKGLRDVIGIVLLALSFFLLVSLFSFDAKDIRSNYVSLEPIGPRQYHNLAGYLGAQISDNCFFWMGAASYLLPPTLLLLGLAQFFELLAFLRRRWTWLIVWAICLTGILDLYESSFLVLRDTMNAPSAGGLVGKHLNQYLIENLIGKLGSTIFYVTAYIVGLIYLTNFQVNDWVRTWRLPKASPFGKDELSKEDEFRQRTLALEKEAKKLKKEMLKAGQELDDPVETNSKKRKTESETEVVDKDEGSSLLDLPEPTIRDMTIPKARPVVDPDEETEEANGKTADGLGEGETIPAEEVRAAAGTDDILGKKKGKKSGREKTSDDAEAEIDEGEGDEATDDEEGDESDEEKSEPVPLPKPKRPMQRPRPVTVASVPMIGNYKRPAMSFLHYAEENIKPSESKEELMANAQVMKNALGQFGIEVALGDITKGPTITRYELHPAPGVKLEKIVNLSNNLTAALKAERINILAPVPGRSSVGIEVPNRVKTKVIMRDLFESDEWEKSKAKIPIALGKDVYGHPLIGDLADMPHLLIAGSTGSGKSVCISSIICSLLYKFSPDELRMVMIDPKVVELQQYNSLPHLVVPVVTDPKKVTLALRWVVNEMENRYKIFAKVGVRNIHSFNTRSREKEMKHQQQELLLTAQKEKIEAGADGFAVEVDEEIVVPREDDIVVPDKLSYIVVVIDELADLMLVAGADVEMAIARITQMARAAGIHCIVATQRPSVDVITGIIKANIPARIAFQVASKVDSRTILDAMGADKLLGKGDMLYMPPGSANLIRAQGALVTDEEIQSVVDFISNQGKPSYEKEIHNQLRKPAAAADMEMGASNEDEDLVQSCIEVIRSEQKASVSLLQRRLRLGYTRAARLMDELEQRGVVGPSKGAEPRDILVDLDGEGYDGL